MGKLSFLAGFAAGYVFGARAGEQRYEQIKLQAGRAWQHPAVQQKVGEATQTLKERGPEVAAAAGQAAIAGAGHAAKSAVAAGYSAAKRGKSGPTVSGELADADIAPDADTDSGSTKMPSARPEYVDGANEPKGGSTPATDPGFDAN